MNKEIIQTAIRNGTLRKYDLNQAQAGDKVLGWKPGKVLAVYGEDVVFGWDRGGRKSVNIFRTHHAHEIYLAPLCWVEDKPVYKGDVLYLPKGTIKVRTIDRVEKFRSYDDDGKAITRLRVYGDDGFWDSPEKLTWTKPKTHIVINGFDVPEPEREPLPNDTTYYVPDLYNGGAWGYEWDNGEVDHRLLNSGLIHLTKEAATAHAKALISLTKS